MLRLVDVMLRLVDVPLRLIDVNFRSAVVRFGSTDALGMVSNQKIRITDSDHVVFCLNVCPSKPCDQSW